MPRLEGDEEKIRPGKELKILAPNMLLTRLPILSEFHFYWPEEVDESLKHKIEFIIKSNESLAESKIKKGDETNIIKM